jgi:5-methylcytosine-specific restriction endonuclease McrA
MQIQHQIIVRPLEVLQAGDCFLLRYVCPHCQNVEMTGINPDNCSVCKTALTDIIFEDAGIRSLRCLVGSRRKSRIGKRAIRIMLENQEHSCAYCMVTLTDKFHIEHILPLSFGGSNNASNLCIACPTCNLKAGSLVFPDLAAKRRWILSGGTYFG